MNKRSGTFRKRITRYSLIAAIPMLIVALGFFAQGVSAQSHFTGCVSGTSINSTVLIPDAAIMSHDQGFFTLEPGDEIAVFNSDKSICTGVMIYTGINDALAVWGDDPFTPDVDGMISGEEMMWMVFDESESNQWNVNVVYVADPNDLFLDNGLYSPESFYQLASFTPTAVTFAGMTVSDTTPLIAVAALMAALGLTTLVLLRRRSIPANA